VNQDPYGPINTLGLWSETSARVEPHPCPGCGKQADALSRISIDDAWAEPEHGMYMVCVYCQEVSVVECSPIGNGWWLREATIIELERFNADPAHRALRESLRATMTEKRRREKPGKAKRRRR